MSFLAQTGGHRVLVATEFPMLFSENVAIQVPNVDILSGNNCIHVYISNREISMVLVWESQMLWKVIISQVLKNYCY